MKVSGSYTFPASAAKVWDSLTDPTVLAGCIPGCEGLNAVGDDEYQAVMTVTVGPIRSRYNAKISLRDKDLHRSFRLVLEGSGTTGFANGEALITLTEQGDQTTVDVEGDSQVGGPVARVGQRMMGTVSKMLMDRFFACLQESMQQPQGTD